jgi:hypothetical protein
LFSAFLQAIIATNIFFCFYKTRKLITEVHYQTAQSSHIDIAHIKTTLQPKNQKQNNPHTKTKPKHNAKNTPPKKPQPHKRKTGLPIRELIDNKPINQRLISLRIICRMEKANAAFEQCENKYH